MKLIVTIVDDQDVDKVMKALTAQRIGVTHISSTGGLLNPGSSTLLIGVDELRWKKVMKIIAEQAAPRQTIVPYAYGNTMAFPTPIEMQIGGYLTFILNIDHFEQV